MSDRGPIGGLYINDIEGSMDWMKELRKHCEAFKSVSNGRVICKARPAMVTDSATNTEDLMIVVSFEMNKEGIH